MTTEWVASCDRCNAALANASENFQFLLLNWDVDRAHAIVRESPRPAVTVPVRACAAIMGFIRIDPEHVRHVPLGEPILVAQYTANGGGGLSIPIDGWHRIARAAQDGLETIDGIYLTLDESNACRLDARVQGKRSVRR